MEAKFVVFKTIQVLVNTNVTMCVYWLRVLGINKKRGRRLLLVWVPKQTHKISDQIISQDKKTQSQTSKKIHIKSSTKLKSLKSIKSSKIPQTTSTTTTLTTSTTKIVQERYNNHWDKYQLRVDEIKKLPNAVINHNIHSEIKKEFCDGLKEFIITSDSNTIIIDEIDNSNHNLDKMIDCALNNQSSVDKKYDLNDMVDNNND